MQHTDVPVSFHFHDKSFMSVKMKRLVCKIEQHLTVTVHYLSVGNPRDQWGFSQATVDAQRRGTLASAEMQQPIVNLTH